MSVSGVYQIDIQKVNNGVYWTNTYHITAGGLLDAYNIGLQIAQIECELLPTYVFVNAIRASTPQKFDKGQFTSQVVNFPGKRTQSGDNNPLPLFNRFMLNFAAAQGYKGRKFLGMVFEADQDNGGVVTAATQLIATKVTTPLEQLDCLCSPDGTPYIQVSLSSRVAMRQLRRQKKRKTPVIPVDATA